MKYLVVFAILILVSTAYAQTPFRDTSGLTKNGIEWCEENYQLYYYLGNDFFDNIVLKSEENSKIYLYVDQLSAVPDNGYLSQAYCTPLRAWIPNHFKLYIGPMAETFDLDQGVNENGAEKQISSIYL